MRFLTSLTSFWLLSYALSSLAAQEFDLLRSADTLPLIAVQASRHLALSTSDRWDEAKLRSSPSINLADLLGSTGGVFIKSYGLGSLATTALRGGSAAHLATFWNALPLDNPMLGLLDLSLLPTAFFTDIALQTGGQSAGWGSGAVAGTLRLNNRAPSEPMAALSLSVGAFGQGALEWQHSWQPAVREGSPPNRENSPPNRWQWVSRLGVAAARNDFPYRLAADLPVRRQTQAALQQWSSLQEIYFQAKPSTLYALRYWGGSTRRELPPTSVQSRSEATQYDAVFRLSLAREKKLERGEQHTNLGFFREHIDYQDPLAGIQSLGLFDRWALDHATSHSFSAGGQLSYGLAAQWVRADIADYEQPATQLRIDPFCSLRFKLIHKGLLQLSLRQPSVDDRLLAPTPSLSYQYSLGKISLGASLNRNFRLPTLNDLYWQNGGNPSLRPEKGWSRELDVRYQSYGTVWLFSYHLSAYHRRLRDWIQWAPTATSVFWEATNLTRVRSRGLSQQMAIGRSLGKGQCQLRLRHEYVEATNEKNIALPRIQAGEQLWYVPFYQGAATISWQSKQLLLRYEQQWIGSVRGQTVASLAGYSLGQLSVAYESKRKNSRLSWSCFAHLDNCWNVSYRVIERRPMPGRAFRLGGRLGWRGRG